MIDLAPQHSGQACAADTLLARHHDLDARVQQGFRDRLICGYRDDPARVGDLDFETAVATTRRDIGPGEELPMQLRFSPAA